ncbi:MAG: ATP-binding protein, partial [Planctomycetota bacterium]
RIEQFREGAWQAQRPMVMLHRIVRPDGAVRHLTTEANVECDGRGRAMRVVGTTQDVTAREVARREMESQIRRQDALAELGRHALEIDDPGQVLQDATEHVAAVLDVPYVRLLESVADGRAFLVRAGVGWGPDIVGHALLDREEDLQAAVTCERGAPVRSGPGTGEGPFRDSLLGGLGGTFHGLSVPIRGKGRPFGVLGVHAPVPRAFPDEDARFLESMAVLVATAVDRKRTEQALVQREQQLVAAQKLEAVARLAGGVAHDFNNLLMVITGFAGLLERRLPDDDPRQREVRAIVKAADRASTLTRQLLAFGRRQVLDLRVLDPNTVVREVIDLLGRTLGEDIVLATELDPDLLRVHADRGRLEQVLLNLAVNARDAMPEGGRIFLRTQNLTLQPIEDRPTDLDPGSYVCISVEDSGTGMTEETRRRIFEPFFSTKPHEKGTGLGLATAHGIVKQMGGHIEVESRLGQGSRFDVVLPALERRMEAGPGGEEAEPARGGQESVLVVEDEPAVRKMAERILCEYGYAVVGADSGEEALALLEDVERAIDLLVGDVVMPAMGGAELAVRFVGRDALLA